MLTTVKMWGTVGGNNSTMKEISSICHVAEGLFFLFYFVGFLFSFVFFLFSFVFFCFLLCIGLWEEPGAENPPHEKTSSWIQPWTSHQSTSCSIHAKSSEAEPEQPQKPCQLGRSLWRHLSIIPTFRITTKGNRFKYKSSVPSGASWAVF